MRIIAYLLITLGVLTMFYPKLNDLYSAYQQKQILESYDHHVTVATDRQARESYAVLNQLFEQEHDQSLVGGEDELVEQELGSSETGVPVNQANASAILGALEIEKINLRLPILAGASQANLRYAAGHLDGTAALGQMGNAGLAAHRSYAYGKLFNRLDELEEGDEVGVVSQDDTYQYIVHKKLLVEPTDVSVLQAIQDEALLTLITCHPLKNPTHRLIVQAKLRQ